MRVNKGIIGIGIGVVLAIVLALVAIQSGLFASLYKIILKDSSGGYSVENVQSTVLHGAAMGEKFMIEENGNTGEWIFVYPSSATQTSSVVFTLSEISMLISGEEIVKSIQGSSYIFFIDSFPVQGMNPYPKVLFASFGGNIYGITANTKNKSLDTFISNFLIRQSNGNNTNNNEGIFGGLSTPSNTSFNSNYTNTGNSQNTNNFNTGNTNTGNTESFINTNGNSGVISGAIGNNSGNTNQNRNAGNVNTMFPNFANESLQKFAVQQESTRLNNTTNSFTGSTSALTNSTPNFAILTSSSDNIRGNTLAVNNAESLNTSGNTKFFTSAIQESYNTNSSKNGSDTSLYLQPDQYNQTSGAAKAILYAGGQHNGAQKTGEYLTNQNLTDAQKQFLNDWSKKFGSTGIGSLNDPVVVNTNNPDLFIDGITGAGKMWIEHSNYQDKDNFYYVISPTAKDGQNGANPFNGQSSTDAAKIVIKISKTEDNNNISEVFTRPVAGTQDVTSGVQNGQYVAPAAFDEWADGYKGKDATADYQNYVNQFSCDYLGSCK